MDTKTNLPNVNVNSKDIRIERRLGRLAKANVVKNGTKSDPQMFRMYNKKTTPLLTPSLQPNNDELMNAMKKIFEIFHPAVPENTDDEARGVLQNNLRSISRNIDHEVPQSAMVNEIITHDQVNPPVGQSDNSSVYDGLLSKHKHSSSLSGLVDDAKNKIKEQKNTKKEAVSKIEKAFQKHKSKLHANEIKKQYDTYKKIQMKKL
jgi:hypothetical protein